MSNDLLYLDYFNGMSEWHNPNTLSLYLTNDIKKGTTVYICSAPFTDQLSYSIAHTYDTSSAGLIGDILKRFNEGVKDGAMFAGSAMMLINQLGDLTKFKSLRDLTHSDKYNKIMNQMLATGNVEVVMPWDDTQTFKKTKNSITTPTIKFQLASSETLGNWLQDKIKNGNFEDNYIEYNKKELENKLNEIIKESTDQQKNESDDEYAIRLMKRVQLLKTYKAISGENYKGITDKEINEIEDKIKNKNNENAIYKPDLGYESNLENDKWKKLPLKAYIEYLIDKLGGSVENGNRFNVKFKQPTSNANYALIANAFKNGGYNIDIPDIGTYFIAIGNNDSTAPIIIDSLFVENITINPSKLLTINKDYAWVDISITLKPSKMLSTNRLKKSMGLVSIKKEN